MSDLTQKLTPEQARAYVAQRFPATATEAVEPAPFDPRDALNCRTEGPAVYVGFWGEYNNGSLYGNWLNLSEIESAEDIQACIQYLRENHADNDSEDRREEWMIQDCQNLPRELMGENPDLEKLAEFSQTAQEVGNDNLPALLAACNNLGQIIDADQFSEAFSGYWDSLEDYAQETAEECAGSREELELMGRWPFNCINWEAAARELEIGGDVWTERIDGQGLAVFRNI